MVQRLRGLRGFAAGGPPFDDDSVGVGVAEGGDTDVLALEMLMGGTCGACTGSRGATKSLPPLALALAVTVAALRLRVTARGCASPFVLAFCGATEKVDLWMPLGPAALDVKSVEEATVGDDAPCASERFPAAFADDGMLESSRKPAPQDGGPMVVPLCVLAKVADDGSTPPA